MAQTDDISISGPVTLPSKENYAVAVWDAWRASRLNALMGSIVALLLAVVPILGFTLAGTDGWTVAAWIAIIVLAWLIFVSVAGGWAVRDAERATAERLARDRETLKEQLSAKEAELSAAAVRCDSIEAERDNLQLAVQHTRDELEYARLDLHQAEREVKRLGGPKPPHTLMDLENSEVHIDGLRITGLPTGMSLTDAIDSTVRINEGDITYRDGKPSDRDQTLSDGDE